MVGKTATQTLRVGYAHLPPFVNVNETDGKLDLGGFMPDILFTVAKWMNFEMEFYREPSDKYGDFENNTWDGMIGMLFKNEVDLVLNPVLPRYEVLDFSYFSNPITIEAYTILSGNEKEEAGLFLYFNVLDKCVWIGILIALVVVSLISTFLYRKSVHLAEFSWSQTFSQYIWLFLSYTLRQSSKESLLLRERSSRLSIYLSVLAKLWAIGIGFVIMNTFQSLLVSKLTLRKSMPLVDTMADLVRRKTVLGVAPSNIQLSHILEHSGVEAYEKAWENIKHNLRPPEIALSTESLLEVESGKICLFHGHLIIKHLLKDFYREKTKCDFHLSDKYFFPFSLPMILSKKFSYSFYERFNAGITRLVDADIAGRTFKYDLREATLCTNYFENELKPLGLENIYGVLLLWGAGLLTATVVLTCEVIHGNHNLIIK
ncbi:glutamate [NMDA] receptor subunit 1-like [Stegodyphus dumicola]|uniref:glutamate [NMDA] receptor subunit 1-like n=1 Tax=Stegodyphus dumicola TaxID=202533 RepID=UPI0015B13775|nr:glutamate [NMDA] receptor subunit 1-like [Stegodyphus dumicola]